MKTTGIVAFAFGAPQSILSNKRISLLAMCKAMEFRAPIFTQQDVFVEPGIETDRVGEQPGNPPPTLQIARGAVRWAKRNGFDELWVVAAEPHLWRCVRDLKEAVRESGENIDVWACEEAGQYQDDFWFCPESAQKRTRSAEAWNWREGILKSLPLFVYKLIAG